MRKRCVRLLRVILCGPLLGMIAACGLVPTEVRHGPVTGFTPAGLTGVPPIAIEARETQPADRVRISTLTNRGLTSHYVGVRVSNDLAAEFQGALSSALQQRGLLVGAGEGVGLLLALEIEKADVVANRSSGGPARIDTVWTGPSSFMLVPTPSPVVSVLSSVIVNVILRNDAGRILFTRRYERGYSAPAEMVLDQTVVADRLGQGMRDIIRQIAYDPDLLGALSTAGRS